MIRIAVLVATVSLATQTSTGTWRKEADLLTSRAAHAVVATADAIYAMAGTGRDGKPVLDVERFVGAAW